MIPSLVSTAPSKSRVGAAVIRICLDGDHADFTDVNAALTVLSTTNASHDSTYKVIVAEDPGARTGDLAPIARDQLGVGVFKDEYVGWADFQRRGIPLTGGGSNRVYYIRPETTWDTSSPPSPTQVASYGTHDGLTYGDAFAGPKGYQDNKPAANATPIRLYICGEHILSYDKVTGGRPIATLGDIVLDQTATTDADHRIEIRCDYPTINVNGYALDRGVLYNGLMVEGSGDTWINGVIALPVSTTTALVAGDITRTITMDTDGDTGTILDYDADTIWVGTDGTAGNSFDNSPTSNDTWTITGGTGAGSQTGVGVLESDLYWWPDRPSRNSSDRGYLRDPGTPFGNFVGASTYEKKVGLAGTANEYTLTVNTAPGGVLLPIEDTISACASNEDSVYEAGGTGDPLVAHIVGGADPTRRLMAPSFGPNIAFGGEDQSNISLIGYRQRQGGPVSFEPTSDLLVEDFSVRYSSAGFSFDPDDWTVDHDDYKFINGCIMTTGNGIYPASAADAARKTDGILAQDIYFEEQGGGEFPQNDNHAIGSQGCNRNWTCRRLLGRNGSGNITLYQWGGWITAPAQHDWGTVLIEYCDFEGPMTDWSGYGSSSTDCGIHLSGDNADEADSGSPVADPPTDKQGVEDVTIRYCRVRDWFNNCRDKWRDYETTWDNLDLDDARDAAFKMSGSSTDDDPDRQPRSAVSNSTFGSGNNEFYAIEEAAAGDYVINSDNNTFVVSAADATKFTSTEFGSQTFAQWQGNSRSGSVFDPNSTRNDP